MKVNYKWNITVLRVLFTQTEKESMLSHTKQLLEDGMLIIDKRFDKFLTRLQTCFDNDIYHSRNLN